MRSWVVDQEMFGQTNMFASVDCMLSLNSRAAE